jgi:hypothetical protein
MRGAEVAVLRRQFAVVAPPAVAAGVGDLGELADACGMQAWRVASVVLRLVQVNGELPGGHHRGGAVLDQQRD